MEIVRDINDSKLSLAACVLTMGNFDGIHLGHQALLRNAVADAKHRRVPSVVLTFEPHPLKVLAPARAPHLLLAPEDKMRLLEDFGVDYVVAQRFNRQFSTLPPREFVDRYLVERLRTIKIWVGRDLRFGQGRKGSVDDLVRWGPGCGFEVGIVDPILLNGVRISSSRIRELIEAGRVEEVEPMLGRYHFVAGTIIKGHARGKQLGFPTANLACRTEVIPLDGIYATLIEVKGELQLSVSSIGVNPTFGEGPRTVETFVLDFTGDLYGEEVTVAFVKRIREERKFTSVERLIDQISRDVSTAREIFRQRHLTARPRA